VLSRLFRQLFLQKLIATHKANRLKFFGDHAALADPRAFAAYLVPPRRAEWVVYAKRPFGGPQPVLAYLSRPSAACRAREQYRRDTSAALSYPYCPTAA